MSISNEGLAIILLVGLVAGWLAGQLVQGTGFGIVGDIIIGIIGAFIGAWLLPLLGVRIGPGIVSAIVFATIGARRASAHPQNCPKKRPLVARRESTPSPRCGPARIAILRPVCGSCCAA
jgi:uncharacterized membrane protein YeaQ/YmgE (transglycosylase-associated protein family)